MSFRTVSEHKFFRPVAGAALAVLCGLLLWSARLGEPWVNASYDYHFLFCTHGTDQHGATNSVVVIFMDNDAYRELGQVREQPWSRALHAKLLNRLADDQCALVAMDVRFLRAGEAGPDQALAAALSRLSNVVLAADVTDPTYTGLASQVVVPPYQPFLAAARTNWGLTWVVADQDDLIIRRHWPFPDPGSFPTLPWRMATLAGAHLSDAPVKRWLCYYGPHGCWTGLHYHVAMAQSSNYFRDKVVFVGSGPKSPQPTFEDDKFNTPYIRWGGDAVGGVEILVTMFLNLVQGDWLERMPEPVEAGLLVLGGILVGGALGFLPRGAALGVAAGTALGFSLLGVCLSWFTHYWFPWLVMVGGQIPCALAWAIVFPKTAARVSARPSQTVVLSFPEEKPPDAPEYEIFEPPIGEGGFGKVWLVRNAIGQYQALKAVYQAKFGENVKPYESEFKGLQKYKPVSEKHPGLLRIDLVSRMKPEGYFYYVMELGDAQEPGWEKNPAAYKARDLESVRRRVPGRRLPRQDCLRIVPVLAEALEFLHSQGLTHRDIKPSNVIFVEGRPKLADIGLVTDIRHPDDVRTIVGTPGYMPPPPEPPGTAQADIYALGMLLYVISTGRDPDFFPGLSTTLLERTGQSEFLRLNAVILKACQPDRARRYAAVEEMLRDLRLVETV